MHMQTGIPSLPHSLAHTLLKMLLHNSSRKVMRICMSLAAVRYFGKDFKAIAEIVGNKTENHVRSFFVTYRKRYNLDNVLREWEEEHGPVRTSADE